MLGEVISILFDGGPCADMEIKTSTKSGVEVVQLIGRFDAQCSGQAANRLDAINGPGISRLLLDMAEVDYISSTGLRVLLNVAKNCKTRNIRLALCGLDPYVYEVFEVAGFTAIFDIYPDQGAGLEAMTGQ